MEKTKMNVFISGLTAAGKTTHATLTANKRHMKFVSASTLLLEQLNVNTQSMPKDLWVSSQAKDLWSRRTTDPSMDEWVDETIKNMAYETENTFFDSWTAPWLAKEASGLRIRLESSLNSRWWKSIVSHGTDSTLTPEEVRKNVNEEDALNRDLFLTKYGFDIYEDLDLFDYILDISDFIKAPTPEASEVSVSKVQKIISAAVGYYFEKSDEWRNSLNEQIELYGPDVFLKIPSTVR